MGILETKFEFTLDKNTNCYFTFMDIGNNKLIPIQCDTGASYTSISALALTDFSFDIKKADKVEQRLLKKMGNEDNFLVKKFEDASGDKILGFLTDIGNVKIGNTKLQHFYYYFVPKNNSAFALVGNDFLNKCEFTHSINGNIVINKFDEDGYYQSHKGAISQPELKKLINRTLNKQIER